MTSRSDIVNVPFKVGNILIPKKTDMYKWCVVACDQYTSEPDYWKEVQKIVGDSPSTLNLTLPEIFLEDDDVEERIKKIDFRTEYDNTKKYWKDLSNEIDNYCKVKNVKYINNEQNRQGLL